jgi:hypothetical protein
MKRYLWITALLGAVAAMGCATTHSAEGKDARTRAQAGVPSCDGDMHCVYAEDYFVCDPYRKCSVARMLSPPAREHGHKARFFILDIGTDLWTDRWFATRQLQDGEEVETGQPILFFDLSVEPAGNMLPPRSRSEAISRGRWYWAKVTDVRGNQVMQSYDHRGVSTLGIRVITSAGPQAMQWASPITQTF